ncbi:SGNH/GDSL hydrolase family protein [Kibdelosporangium philippinense]|uniref:SGNH/GDSL hydrolase family protein n=1 Tax=Kibdelosporangium philippinense TaxID=211113 RepID=A0ABS8ZED3_9PSEU|nr:SGNH/GDSL hydrolase family protein [Kibdelosporangium philippinense]MCE7006158.1 SGNH/GDSL hydrolase family protein [Kibdelosporangium philippinense]
MRRPFRVLLSLAATAVGLTVLSVPANAAAENYVALGDSYSSGLGTGGPYSGGNCKRSTGAYPQLWANSHSPASFSFAACSGATTSDVLNSQVNSLSASTTLVTISIGGNDAGFVDVITTCTLNGDSACVNRVEQGKTFVRDTLPARLDNTYNAIKQRSPSARVVVLGYPRFYKVPGSCSVGLSDTKRAAINSGADALAEVTAQRAAAAGFRFVDIRPIWTGHEICASDRWLNSLTWPVDESYHPNRNGQSGGYLPALNAALSLS